MSAEHMLINSGVVIRLHRGQASDEIDALNNTIANICYVLNGAKMHILDDILVNETVFNLT